MVSSRFYLLVKRRREPARRWCITEKEHAPGSAVIDDEDGLPGFRERRQVNCRGRLGEPVIDGGFAAEPAYAFQVVPVELRGERTNRVRQGGVVRRWLGLRQRFDEDVARSGNRALVSPTDQQAGYPLAIRTSGERLNPDEDGLLDEELSAPALAPLE